jgi:hypothetical protein
MTSKTLISRLERQEGGLSAAARALGVSPQRLHNWRERELTEDGHLRVWLALYYRDVLREWRRERVVEELT